MRLAISINLDNSAFEVQGEIQRMLSRISEDVEMLNLNAQSIINSGNTPNRTRQYIKDSNGNTVGSFTVEADDETQA